jgi:hypothetical protein
MPTEENPVLRTKIQNKQTNKIHKNKEIKEVREKEREREASQQANKTTSELSILSKFFTILTGF